MPGATLQADRSICSLLFSLLFQQVFVTVCRLRTFLVRPAPGLGLLCVGNCPTVLLSRRLLITEIEIWRLKSIKSRCTASSLTCKSSLSFGPYRHFSTLSFRWIGFSLTPVFRTRGQSIPPCHSSQDSADASLAAMQPRATPPQKCELRVLKDAPAATFKQATSLFQMKATSSTPQAPDEAGTGPTTTRKMGAMPA